MTPLQQQLRRLGSSQECIDWAADYPDFPAAWKACPRGDWMIWWLIGTGTEVRSWPIIVYQDALLYGGKTREEALVIFADAIRDGAECPALEGGAS